MFEEGLQARGQKAVNNALDIAKTYERDPKLARRVANILFMICNISQTDQLLFPASVDNVTSLLVNDMTVPRLTIKNEVEKVIEFLCDNNIIRREQGKQGAPDTYTFYSEEEMKVAQLIQSQAPDNNAQAEQLKDLFFKYLSALKNKVQYGTRSFALGACIKQRNFLSNSPDIVVDFVMDADYDNAETLALHNQPNRMVYYVGPKFRENKRLFNTFYWYCQVNGYMATPIPNEDNAKTRKEFEKRAEEVMQTLLIPEFQKILDTCPIISGLSVIDDVELGNKRGNDRYNLAIQKHLSNIYTKAKLVTTGMPSTTDQLKKSILRNVQPGEYEGFNAELTPAEKEVEIYLNKQFNEVNVADVLAKFAKAPYGWDNICTLYVINELVRRHNRDYSYANNPNVETNIVASRIVTETNKFTLREAKAINPQVVQQFTNAWKDIFGTTNTFSTTDSTQIFRLCREPENERSLAKCREGYRKVEAQISSYAFAAPIREAIDLFESWLNERDQLKFFQAVISKQQEAHELIDKCKEVVQFTHDQLDTYKQILNFVKENAFNFSFVPMEQQDKVAAILKIESDEWPISSLRGYIRLQKELSYALDGVRESLRQKIRNSYNDVFSYLENVAKEQNVPISVLSNRENVIDKKTTPSNIMVLQNNISTDAFYQAEIAKILDYVPPTPKTKKEEEKADDTPPATPKRKRVRQASLQTKTQLPISTEEDIDRYLAGLKNQLLKLLVDHDSVMIIK